MKIVTTLAALVIAASAVHAQTAQAGPEQLKTKALSFNFNGLNLNGLNGGVGGKLWLSESRALVLGVGGSVSSQTTEASDSTNVDDQNSASGLNVSVSVEEHLTPGARISPYLVGGASLGFSRNDREYGPAISPYKSESSSTSLGLHAGVGLEYWLTSRISVAGQQLFSGSFSFGSTSSGSGSQTEQDTRRFSLGLGTSALILSVYL